MPEWKVSETRHYVLIMNIEDAVFRKAITKHAGRIGKVIAVDWPAGEGLIPPCIVRLARNRSEYHKYGGPGDTTVYWSRRQNEIVTFDDRGIRRAQTFWALNSGVLFHYMCSRGKSP